MVKENEKTSSIRENIRKYIWAYNNFDIEGMLSMLDDEITFENYSNNLLTTSTKGKSEFRQLATNSASLFSSRNQTPIKIQVYKERARVTIKFEATFAVDIDSDGFSCKAGDTQCFEGTSEIFFSNNKIIKIIDKS